MVKGGQQHCKIKVKFPDGKAFMYNTDIAVSIGSKVRVGGKRCDDIGEVVSFEGRWENSPYMQCVTSVLNEGESIDATNVCISDVNVTDSVLNSYKGSVDELYKKMAAQYGLAPCEGYSYDPWKEIKIEEGGLFQFSVSEEAMLGFGAINAVTPECARTLGKFQNKMLLDGYCHMVRFSVPREVEANAKKIIEGKAVKWPRVYTYVERVVPTSELPASVPLNEGMIDIGFSYDGKVPYKEFGLDRIYSIRKEGTMTLPLRIRLGGKVSGPVSFRVEEGYHDTQELVIMVDKEKYYLNFYAYARGISLSVPTEYNLIEEDESMLDVIVKAKIYSTYVF